MGRGGDEGLVPVQVDLAVAAGVGGAAGCRLGAGARFGAWRSSRSACRCRHTAAWSASASLCPRAEWCRSTAAGRAHRWGHPTAQLLVDGSERDPGRSEAVVLLGQHDEVEAQVAQRLHPPLGVRVVVVALGEVGLPVLALHQFADIIDEQLLVVIEAEIHHCLLQCRAWYRARRGKAPPCVERGRGRVEHPGVVQEGVQDAGEHLVAAGTPCWVEHRGQAGCRRAAGRAPLRRGRSAGHRG